MQTLKVCWNCKKRFHATEPKPGLGYKVCPRCGNVAHNVSFSKRDRSRGTKHYVTTTDTVMRCGRERQELLATGKYKYNPDSKTTDVLDGWLPIYR